MLPECNRGSSLYWPGDDQLITFECNSFGKLLFNNFYVRILNSMLNISFVDNWQSFLLKLNIWLRTHGICFSVGLCDPSFFPITLQEFPFDEWTNFFQTEPTGKSCSTPAAVLRVYDLKVLIYQHKTPGC